MFEALFGVFLWMFWIFGSVCCILWWFFSGLGVIRGEGCVCVGIGKTGGEASGVARARKTKHAFHTYRAGE